MKIGISTASLFLRRNNEDALPLFDSWGVACAEVFLTSFSEYVPSFSRTLAERKGSVLVHSVHVLNTQFEPQLYAQHPRVRADAFALLEDVMASAELLGAHNYTFHGIARIKRTFREDLASSARQTQEIYEACLRHGVRLCYENVEWALCNRPGVFSRLRQDCPGLGAVLDIKQARITGYDWREYLAETGSSLVTVHVSDHDGAGRMCLPGRGEFPFGELFARLADAGFGGAVLIENYARDYAEEEELRGAYEYLCDLAARCA